VIRETGGEIVLDASQVFELP